MIKAKITGKATSQIKEDKENKSHINKNINQENPFDEFGLETIDELFEIIM